MYSSGTTRCAIVVLWIVLHALQWQTFARDDDLSRHRMTAIAASENRTTFCEKESHPSRNDICTLLPVDVSASFIWNQKHANNRNGDVSILNNLNAYQLLRGVRQVHSQNSWRRLWEDRTSDKDSPFRVWVFANPLDVQQSNDCSQGQTCPSPWLQLLNETANQYCHLLNIEWTIFDWSFATTELYTQLLTAQRGKEQGPDLIFHALSRHDLRYANMENRDPHTVLWEEERRRVLQDFVRAGRRSNPCRDTVIIFVDDYVPSMQPSLSLWVEQVNSRMLQQISEYYRTGLISYSQVVTELMFLRKEYRSLLIPNDLGDFGEIAHNVLAHCVLYGLLHFAVTFCNTKDPMTATADVEPMVPADITKRVKTIVPPVLDAEQTLLTVSGEWILQEELERQFQERYCTIKNNNPPSNCLAAFYAGQSLATLGNGVSPDGWMLSPEGILRFRGSANLRWSFNGNEEVQTGYEGGRIRIFVRLQEKNDMQFTWTVSSQNMSTTGSFSTQNHTLSSTIAVPMVEQLPDRIENDLSFRLECSDPVDTVEIVGLFLCQEEPIQRITS
ncbi:hypothetical protein FisN_4Hh270 [Fistulifera solaris]|uniref:Uncharacterized protein n=1 Tax=Fistulifera solaris TaxID=1519565 RepID=A0A1Z5KF39_FISSO|nr:hypothetical protein FisN_4Hh270 [Fistulifera solaris]|eukprot:GAX24712.1 hypothetical protein FisN_4Hh270 [Fistulifera solaris]